MWREEPSKVNILKYLLTQNVMKYKYYIFQIILGLGWVLTIYGLSDATMTG